jgi:hypothetical protein
MNRRTHAGHQLGGRSSIAASRQRVSCPPRGYPFPEPAVDVFFEPGDPVFGEIETLGELVGPLEAQEMDIGVRNTLCAKSFPVQNSQMTWSHLSVDGSSGNAET